MVATVELSGTVAGQGEGYWVEIAFERFVGDDKSTTAIDTTLWLLPSETTAPGSTSVDGRVSELTITLQEQPGGQLAAGIALAP